MDVKYSTKKILLSLIDECDLILKEYLSVITSSEENINSLRLLDLLIDKDEEIKKWIPQANEQIKMQKVMDYLKTENDKRDKMILSAQLHLRKSEIILNTALYYSRKKLNIISTAVANPVDPEEVIKYGHKITAGHGVVAPHNWLPGDKSRPFPTDENIKKGFLGNLDSSGDWAPSLLDFVAANSESRFSSLLGMGPPRDTLSQALQSPLASPRVSQHIPGVPRTPTIDATAVHSVPNVSMNQLPPGVNVVSSPSANMHRGPQMSTSTPTVYSQTCSGTPSDIRGNMASSRVQQDDVEVMTDSCSSSSSDVF